MISFVKCRSVSLSVVLNALFTGFLNRQISCEGTSLLKRTRHSVTQAEETLGVTVRLLTVAVGAVRTDPALRLGRSGFVLRAAGLGRFAVVDSLLLTAARAPEAHVQVAVAELAGAFGHWTHKTGPTDIL